MSNPKSTASIAGHPIHPMLIPFPIAFFVATFLCDLAYWQTSNGAWATAAIWLLGAGLVMAALAAVAGLTDVLGEPRIRALRDVWWHAGGNVLLSSSSSCIIFTAAISEGTSAIRPDGESPGRSVVVSLWRGLAGRVGKWLLSLPRWRCGYDPEGRKRQTAPGDVLRIAPRVDRPGPSRETASRRSMLIK